MIMPVKQIEDVQMAFIEDVQQHIQYLICFLFLKTYNIKERREILLSICEIFDIIGIDKTKLIIVLENEGFSDFEDCLQMECARDYGAKYIVTRNIADYEKSEIKAISPSDFLKGELMH